MVQIIVLALIFVTVAAFALALLRRPQAERIQGRLAAMPVVAPITSIVDHELSLPFADRFLRPAWASISRLALRLTPSGSAQVVQQMLDTAGNPPSMGVREFAVARVASVLLGVVWAVCLYMFLTRRVGWAPWMAGAAAALQPLCAWQLPVWQLRGMGERRQRQIRKALPDTLDLLVVSVEAGLGFDAAIAKVVMKMRGALSDELRRVLEGMQLGKARAQALKEMARRVQIAELNGFVGAINQADQLGTSIARMLRVQAEELRISRQQRVQELAAKLPVKMLFPLVLLILPATFIVLAAPGFLRVIQALAGH